MTIKILFGWCFAFVVMVGSLWGMVFPNTFLGPMADYAILQWIARGMGFFFFMVGVTVFFAYREDLAANLERFSIPRRVSRWKSGKFFFGACIFLLAITGCFEPYFSSHPNDAM